MNRLLCLLVLTLVAAPALPLLAAPALAADAPSIAEPPSHPGKRLSWEQHFAQANTAHDGHLTLEEAKAGYKTIARSFEEIDVDHKGYVTENDIRAWKALRKAGRHAADSPADSGPNMTPQPYPAHRALLLSRTKASVPTERHSNSTPQTKDVPQPDGMR